VAKVAAITGDSAPALRVGQAVVRIDPRDFRPTEVEALLGDHSKSKKDLGWVPEITLDEMVQEMVAYDLSKAKQHALLKAHGFEVRWGWSAKSCKCNDRAKYKHDCAKLVVCHSPMPFLLTVKRVCFAGCLVSHNDLFS
jgi:GDP-mannose 4,6 dehydratase